MLQHPENKTVHDAIKKVQQAIQTLKQGQMVLLCDDDDRECEADFIISACKATTQHLNVMCKQGSGIICVSLSPQKAHDLNLPLMQAGDWNDSHQQTAFTCSVEAKEGVTTGVSVLDRLTTIQLFAKSNTQASDFVRPGHVFPLQAHKEGIFGRRGHTEGSLQLMQLADLSDAAVICEAVDDNGMPLKGNALLAFAKHYAYPLLSIQHIMDYLYYHGAQIQTQANAYLPTTYGDFYHRAVTDDQGKTHSILTTFNPQDETHLPQSCLVRIHSSCTTGDLFSSLKCDCHEQYQTSLKRIAKEGGIFIYLDQEGRGIGLVNKLKAYNLQKAGYDTVDANQQLGLPVDARNYALACTLIRQSGVTQIRLMTNNPDKIKQCFFYGLNVIETIAMPSTVNTHNQTYLKTKVTKLNHHNVF